MPETHYAHISWSVGPEDPDRPKQRSFYIAIALIEAFAAGLDGLYCGKGTSISPAQPWKWMTNPESLAKDVGRRLKRFCVEHGDLLNVGAGDLEDNRAADEAWNDYLVGFERDTIPWWS